MFGMRKRSTSTRRKPKSLKEDLHMIFNDPPSELTVKGIVDDGIQILLRWVAVCSVVVFIYCSGLL